MAKEQDAKDTEKGAPSAQFTARSGKSMMGAWRAQVSETILEDTREGFRVARLNLRMIGRGLLRRLDPSKMKTDSYEHSQKRRDMVEWAYRLTKGDVERAQAIIDMLDDEVLEDEVADIMAQIPEKYYPTTHLTVKERTNQMVLDGLDEAGEKRDKGDDDAEG